MRHASVQRIVGFLAISAGTLVIPAARGQALVVSVRSLDALLSDARYLVGLAAGEQEVKQIDAFMKGVTAGKELTGLDTGRPFGVYANWPKGLVAKGLTPIPIVGFIPVASEKNVLAFLAGLGLQAKKAETDIYRLDVGGGMPLFFRFAHRHAFVALDPIFLRNKLLDPTAIVPAEAGKSLLYGSLRMDRVAPEEKQRLADAILSPFGRVADQKKMDGESEQEYKARLEMRRVQQIICSPITESKEIALRLGVDQVRHRLQCELTLVPVRDSSLAANIDALGKSRSMFAGWARNAKVCVFTRFPVAGTTASKPPEVFNDLEDVVDPRRRPLMRRAVKALVHMSELTIVDFGLAFHAEKRGWTWTAGLYATNGHKMESFLREFIKDLPAADREMYRVRWNYAIHGSTRIHKGRLPFSLGKRANQGRTIYLAIRDNVVVASTGVGIPDRSADDDADTPALDALKEALDLIDKPPSGAVPVFRADLSPGWAASMMAVIKDQLGGKAIPSAWHQMIALGDLDSEEGKKLGDGIPAKVAKALGKGNLDKVRASVTVEGGATLRLTFDLHTHTLKLPRVGLGAFSPAYWFPIGRAGTSSTPR